MQVYDGVALTQVGDTVLSLWKAGARVHRSRWIYDFLDDLAPRVPGGLLGLMVILPTSEPPDRATRQMNATRLRRLRPWMRRLVTVPLGDLLRFTLVRSVIRGMALTGGWSQIHFVEGTQSRGFARLLQAAGPLTPTDAELDASLRAQFEALELCPEEWLGDAHPSIAPAITSSFPPSRVRVARAPHEATDAVEVTPELSLLRPLGRGGMSVLWVAEHRGLQSEVVVKFLRDRLGDHPEAPERVAREAASAARVRSPHVVQVLDRGVSAAGLPFLVMEHLEGCDLRRYLEVHGCLSCKETATVVHQLAAALEKTHGAGLVHCDVKPSNVFLCAGEDLFVKLLDFGLARRSATTEDVGGGPPVRGGTPPYMSPEQIAGGPLDGRSDVWSLGVLAVECLTGVRPFEGETTGAMRLAIETLPIPRPSGLLRTVPASFDAWFAKACARSPFERFCSAPEAANALSSALDVDVRPERFRHPSGVVPRHGAAWGSVGTRTG
jgi:hypothetical protein